MNPQLLKDVWYRRIPVGWSRGCRYRTSVPASVLVDSSVRRALFIVESGVGVLIAIADLRSAVGGLPVHRGQVGPFDLDLESSTINGASVSLQVLRRQQTCTSGVAPGVAMS